MIYNTYFFNTKKGVGASWVIRHLDCLVLYGLKILVTFSVYHRHEKKSQEENGSQNEWKILCAVH